MRGAMSVALSNQPDESPRPAPTKAPKILVADDDRECASWSKPGFESAVTT